MRICSLLLLTSLLLSACSEIKLVKVDSNRNIVTNDNKIINIAGSPPMQCVGFNRTTPVNGFFVYQKLDGSFYLDLFGTGYTTVENPVCTFLTEDK